MTDQPAPPPVFVHAWWRSASTWLWAKLRDRPGLRCYYEPLNERLLYWTADGVRRIRPDNEKLRAGGHPALARHYFAEYLPLYESGGPGFSLELAYERYLLGPEEADPALHAYLAGLLASARAAGERPVLCFVRSPLRALWMRRQFGGLHLAQLRNPRDQWGSFVARGGRDSYFTAGMLHIATRLRARRPGLFSHLGAIRAPGARGLPELRLDANGFAGAYTPPGPAREYAIFMLLWLASALQSLSAADIVIDSDRMSADPAACAAAMDRLAAAGLAADLTDAAVARHPALPLKEAQLEAIEALALRQLAGPARSLALFDPVRVQAALGALAPVSRGLVERALAAIPAPAR